MKSARVWAMIAVAILVAVNVWIFYPTKQRPLSPDEIVRAQLEFIESQRRTWADSEVVPLDDPSLESIVRKLNSENCLELPKDAKPIAVGELDADAERDLCAAIAGLCRAYLVDTSTRGKSVVEYMHERGETFAPKDAESWRDDLRKEGRAVPGRGANENVNLVAAIYQSFPWGAHWKSLRPGGSCWRLYRVSQYGDEESGGSERRAWHGSAGSRHVFEPKHTLAEQLKSAKTLLLCDAKLVIDHDASLRGTTVPYYLGFWWSSADHRWHPLHIAWAPTDLGHMGLTVFPFF